MKKVLFVLEHMLSGGVEKSLINLIESLPKGQYDISVLVVKKEGEFIGLLPDYVNINEIPMPEYIRNDIYYGTNTRQAIKKSIKEFDLKKSINILYMKIIKNDPLARLGNGFSEIPILEEKYDIAICYHVHCQYLIRYVAEKVNSKFKIAWIHNDFESTHFKIEKYSNELEKYNRIFCVSKQLITELLNRVPQFKNKVYLFENIVSKNNILDLSKEFIPEEFKNYDGIKLLSIGRLNKQKGFDLAALVCKKLASKGLDFKWFVMGVGEEKERLEIIIKELDIEEKFILIGSKVNPYPYIDNCDIYIQPSRHEGYGIAVAEARILNKPILCTNFAGAKEQLKDNDTGLIVKFDENELFNAAYNLIIKKELREKFSENLYIENKDNFMAKQLKLFTEL